LFVVVVIVVVGGGGGRGGLFSQFGDDVAEGEEGLVDAGRFAK